MIMGLLRRGLLSVALLKASMGFSLILNQSPVLTSSSHHRYSATTMKMGLRSFIQNRVQRKDKKEIFKTVAQKRIKEPLQLLRTQVVSIESDTKGDTATSSGWNSKTEIKEAEPFSYRLGRLRSGKFTEEEKEEFVQNSLGSIAALRKFSSPRKPPSISPPTKVPPRQQNPMFGEIIEGQKETEIVSDLETQKMEFLRMVTNPNRFDTKKRKKSDTIIKERRSGTIKKDISSPLPLSNHSKNNDLGSRLQAAAMAQEHREQEKRRKAEHREQEQHRKAEEERQEAQLLKDRERRRSMEQQAMLQAEAERRKKIREEEEARKEEELKRMKAKKVEDIMASQEEYWNNWVQKERIKKHEEQQEQETMIHNNDQSVTKEKVEKAAYQNLRP